ncbi:poly-gamma-glutamate biosynthesis protein PgsC [Staphylococcus warneri]|jgi:poly-gamma-glutamate biosynthesis protein PgsC/CapC|uniref:Poly-gamma-glutamate biosynthesis protein PgsC n=3 Tax=Staphylococcus TaxID=1279 RepID=A0A2T4Q424_STAWA|nr:MULTISPECIES: poly-gamma-glutamate biosynthesis protein PgsC [Staphylococcus]MBE9429945.1 poly-gamma-glutamate biosynthesis protein PgsC [Staphylococcus epidermidis]MBJ7885024.1 poly-gamma-glutamate biosynthesis protein PgsC [Bacillaceae bacterium HSR45]MCR4456026.1 poly-gamma-glutamate biosynthesis protein PgsC [Aeromonas salmonicida]ODB76395.1 poly-gamma-glutamate biosynthesis protein PgsC [Staphylococcus sp. AOAB]QAV30494.1 poly-gamma-glutamate biosynthesis protein PgsC [Sulfitobacter do
MIGSELYFSLFVGVVLSLIFAEKFGINPAGLVVPGYLALIFDQPIMLLSVLIISCLTFFIVNNGISKWVILYGRRKFAAMILTGMVLKFIFDLIYPLTPFEMVEVSGIGVVIPGIIANTIQKQGVVITLSSTMLLTCITYVILFLYSFIN